MTISSIPFVSIALPFVEPTTFAPPGLGEGRAGTHGNRSTGYTTGKELQLLGQTEVEGSLLRNERVFLCEGASNRPA
jgi:hypothetical protein